MALFKEINCRKCGKKTNVLTRTKLIDGNYICGDCVLNIPNPFKNNLNRFTYQQFEEFKSYIEYSKIELSVIFNETHSFQGVYLDFNNKLFYTKTSLLDEPLYFELKYLDSFDYIFMPNEVKDGLLEKKVTGKLTLIYSIEKFNILYNETHNKNIKASAKSNFLGTKLSYGNPNGMDDFLSVFEVAWKNSRTYTSLQSSSSNELEQAMILFMIDNLEEITLETLKQQRNKLIKSYHPDVENDIDIKYVQKINNAFEILKAHLS